MHQSERCSFDLSEIATLDLTTTIAVGDDVNSFTFNDVGCGRVNTEEVIHILSRNILHHQTGQVDTATTSSQQGYRRSAATVFTCRGGRCGLCK